MAATDSPPTAQEDTLGVRARLASVRRQIAAAAGEADRDASAISLVAVSKGFGPEALRAAQAAGQVDFGESRVQELNEKLGALDSPLRWHFVGRLQRNKAKDVVGTVSLIHSMDRLELAETIAGLAQARGRVQRVLVQVNAGEDPAKAGCAPEEAVELIARVRAMDGIACQGLMTIPPQNADPRPVFRRLRELRDSIREQFPEVQHLSMGMSADYEQAVGEGATIVRLGEAIFGPRPS